MEDRIAGHSPADAIADVAAPVAWRDLRDWLDLVETNGLLKHIASSAEPDATANDVPASPSTPTRGMIIGLLFMRPRLVRRRRFDVVPP